ALFTQALKARAAAYYATEGGGASYWTTASTALAASFLNGSVTTRAALDAGVYDIYSTAPGDINNTLSQATNTDLYAHMSIQADAQKQADGTTPDLRYTTKIRTAATRLAPQNLAASSSLGFSIWPSLTTPIPIIRNEELILLRAEARLATGDKAGAIADINTIRTVSGGLAPTPLTAAATSDEILTELLYNKRYSLLMEGHRWVDLRRYGRLNTLPLDITTGTNTHFVPKVMPIPQAECLQRAPYPTGNLHGPGC
ncbi:MAG TPA: RagB/SusD family nutrient uptake outer membrane protein, partial [Gemmatimonadaceae bacterium]|nr:RagB/SusD family nutrient uptake outer membrane protein [Gemmatimonadaceae bacterium]